MHENSSNTHQSAYPFWYTRNERIRFIKDLNSKRQLYCRAFDPPRLLIALTPRSSFNRRFYRIFKNYWMSS